MQLFALLWISSNYTLKVVLLFISTILIWSKGILKVNGSFDSRELH